jgi:hypothetical protein
MKKINYSCFEKYSIYFNGSIFFFQDHGKPSSVMEERQIFTNISQVVRRIQVTWTLYL